MRTLTMRTLVLAASLLLAAHPARAQNQRAPKAQIVIVVDVSQSMRSFVDATRQRVLARVDKLSGGAPPDRVELALVVHSGGRGRLLTPFTTDWKRTGDDQTFLASTDEPVVLSQKFSEDVLAGGDEVCGAVLEFVRDEKPGSRNQTFVWRHDSDVRGVVIAGNEDFNHVPPESRAPRGTDDAQRYPDHRVPVRVPRTLPNGTVVFVTELRDAPLSLFTIHAGPRAEGKRHHWEEAAGSAGGEFDNVDPNATR